MVVCTLTSRGFGDLEATTEEFKRYIVAIQNAGITVVCGNGNYCAGRETKREEMAAFIIRALYGEEFNYSQNPYFNDVPADNYFFKYIQKMKDVGITRTSGEYMVGQSVTMG